MSIFAGIKEKITGYIDVYIKLIKVNFIGQTANLLSYLMFAMISLFIVLCILLFLGFGLTEAFVALGLPKVASFFITVGIYVLCLLLVLASRKKMTRFFANGIIRVMTEGDEEKE